jgi:hypothetical protein
MDHLCRSRHRAILGIVLTQVAVILFCGGCGPKFGKLPTYMHPERLYLNTEPYDRIYVEVDVIEGATLPEDYIDTLRQFLETHCYKPKGITIVQDDPVPISDFNDIPIDYVPVLCIDGPNRVPGKSAYIHFLCHDGDSGHWKKVKKADIPMAKIEGSQISINLGYGNNGFERCILHHEVGHLLGLCKNKSHGDGMHCNNYGCLIQRSPTWVEQTKKFLHFKPKAELCSDCLKDLNTGRSRVADKVYFEGPFLVREESTYAIMMLGGVCRFFVPKALLADFEWQKVLSKIKRPLPDMLKTWEEKGKGHGCIWTVLTPEDGSLSHESLLAALNDASENEPNQHIRGHVKQSLMQMQTE